MDAAKDSWHALSVAEVLRLMDAREAGLGAEEAGRRLAVYGPNLLRPPKRRGPLLRFLAQFHNLLLYVLIGSAVVTAFLAQWVDMGVILGVVVINAVFGYLQEGKAERALDAIRTMLSPRASVLRDGRRLTVPAQALVPGDIVLLSAGDKVPADIRLLRVTSLLVQEAPLTGESLPVSKSPTALPPRTGLGDRASMAHAGTMVTHGEGVGVVVATGESTELGRISTLLTEVERLTTPLLRQIDVFARWLTAIILAVAAAAFAFGVLVRDYAMAEMFMAAVGLAVAAIPEGLPPVMTITLAIGVTRMARRNAIIRRLPAVETLGSVTVICADKTGTLTRNELVVQNVVTAGRAYTVSGDGYQPVGEYRVDGSAVDPRGEPDLVSAARAAILCNDADLVEAEGTWRLHGDPTEGALLAAGLKAGLDGQRERQTRPRTDLIPFDPEHKFMASLHHDHEGRGYVYIKGAPERILDMCAHQRLDGRDVPLDRAYWHERTEAMAVDAQRVLAIATHAAPPSRSSLRFDDIRDGLTLLAVFGLIDAPREEALAAVARCRAAGIQVKMVTGDHIATARAIAARLGLGGEDGVRAGSDIDLLDDQALADVAAGTSVFARTTPEHKLRLVRALQAGGEVVAMTGDGVNDAPALKRADIGIAMGLKGTEAAKEASEMVLADDNFASIVRAVEEGRTVYDNLKKAILFLLPTSGGEALAIIIAILLGQVLPITPVQILWVNMITAVTLGIALAFEPAEVDVMGRPPRRPGEPILSAFLTWRIVFVSLLLVAAVFGLFLWERASGASLEAARTVAVNVLVAGEVVYLINSRRILGPCWTWDGLFGSRPVLIAILLVALFQLLITYLPWMQALFGTAAIGPREWGIVIGTALTLFGLVELEKGLVRRYARGAGRV